jgi:hypothetical protein
MSLTVACFSFVPSLTSNSDKIYTRTILKSIVPDKIHCQETFRGFNLLARETVT